jgi:hypothetical protein
LSWNLGWSKARLVVIYSCTDVAVITIAGVVLLDEVLGLEFDESPILRLLRTLEL